MIYFIYVYTCTLIYFVESSKELAHLIWSDYLWHRVLTTSTNSSSMLFPCFPSSLKSHISLLCSVLVCFLLLFFFCPRYFGIEHVARRHMEIITLVSFRFVVLHHYHNRVAQLGIRSYLPRVGFSVSLSTCAFSIESITVCFLLLFFF